MYLVTLELSKPSLANVRFFLLLLLAMAASSSNLLPSAMTNSSPPNLTSHEKLEGSNYLSWQTQFLPILRSQESMGIVDGTEPCPPKYVVDEANKQTLNPAYSLWQRKDQTILSWINLTLSKKVLSTIYGLETSRQVWTALANQFANQSKPELPTSRHSCKVFIKAPRIALTISKLPKNMLINWQQLASPSRMRISSPISPMDLTPPSTVLSPPSLSHLGTTN
jgi:hypothetical protein